MKHRVLTTIVYGLASALTAIPTARLAAHFVSWPTALALVLWMDLFFYAIFLARWSQTPFFSILYPLVLLPATALLADRCLEFIIFGLGVLAWIRSGICFRRTPFRCILAETITLVGGTGLVFLFRPETGIAWAMGIWLFFLVQALYFFLVPMTTGKQSEVVSIDSFEHALQKANRLLEG